MLLRALNFALLTILLASSAGLSKAQDSAPASVETSEGTSRDAARVDATLVLKLERAAQLESSGSGLDEPSTAKRMAEFYKAAYGFIAGNPRFAGAKQNERLLDAVIAVSQADRKTRRVRTLGDTFEVAAQRLDALDREESIRIAWQKEVEQFLDEHPRYRADEDLMRALDGAVRALGSDPQNDLRDARWLLRAADAIVSSGFPDPATGADATQF